MSTYDTNNPTKFTLEECEAAVGQHALLPLTGTITGVRQSPAGPYVMFKPDERWGMNASLGLDLDALELDDESTTS